MTAVTFDPPIPFDATASLLFKGFRLCERVVVRVRVRFLIEFSRLLFLGFYEDFRRSIDAIERELDRTETEMEFKRLWAIKKRVAQNVKGLVQDISATEGFRYRGRSLLDYLVGTERLGELRLFVEAAELEDRAERILDQSKDRLVTAFARQSLTDTQRAALLDKYRELFKAPGHTK